MSLNLTQLIGFAVGGGGTPSTSYANTGGTGDRTAIITATSNITWDGGSTDSNLVDGGFALNSTDSVDAPGTGSTAIADGAYVRFDFSAMSGGKQYIDEFKIYYEGAPANGAWKIQGGNDGAAWTDLASFTWDTATQSIAMTGMPVAGYVYYRIVKDGAGTNWTNNYIKEFEFKIANGN